MACPKTLELLWMFDKKLSDAQEDNFQKHFGECAECCEKANNAQKYFSGRSGVIIHTDETSCVSDPSLVRAIRMENTFEEAKFIEEHLKKCKRCLKRLVDFYTGALSQEDVLTKEAANVIKRGGDDMPTSTIYGDKMDKVDWWLGGSFHFLGLKFSKLYVAISGAFFVSIVLVFLLLLNQYLSEEKQKSILINQGDRPEEKKNSDSIVGEEEKEIPLLVHVLAGQCILSKDGKRERWNKGEMLVLSKNRLLVRERQSVLLGMKGANLWVQGPASFGIKSRKKSFSLDFEKGLVMLEVFSNTLSFEIKTIFKRERLTLQILRSRLLLQKEKDEAQILCLSGVSQIFYGTSSLALKKGFSYTINKTGEGKKEEISELPKWYFDLFSERVPLFKESFKEDGLPFELKSGKGKVQIAEYDEEKFFQMSSSDPPGILVESTSFYLQPSQAYLIHWKYRLLDNPSKPTLSLVGKDGGGSAYYVPVRLENAEDWKTGKMVIFTSHQVSEREPAFLRLSYLGKGRLDLKELRIFHFVRPRNILKKMNFQSASPLGEFELLSGTFEVQQERLEAKSTLREGVLMMSGIPKNYFHLSLEAHMGLPFGVVFDYKDKDNFYLWEFLPQEKQVRFLLRKKGVETLLKKVSLENMALPYNIHLMKRQNYFFAEINDTYIMERVDDQLEKTSKTGLWIFPETKQIFSKMEVYRE